MKKKVYIAILLIYLYLPLIVVCIYSFDNSMTMSSFNGLTLDNYFTLFSNTDLLIALINSLVIAFINSTFSLLIGLAIVFGMYSIENKRVNKMFFSINNVMLISPDIVIGVSFLIMYTFLRVQLGFYTVLISHIIFSVPIVIITIYPKLKEISNNQINAAYDLGANNIEVIFKVLIPALQNIIIFAFILSFIYSVDDFGVTYFVTGNGFTTLPILIYSMVKRGVGLDVNALFTIIFIIVMSCVLLYHFIERKKK